MKSMASVKPPAFLKSRKTSRKMTMVWSSSDFRPKPKIKLISQPTSPSIKPHSASFISYLKNEGRPPLSQVLSNPLLNLQGTVINLQAEVFLSKNTPSPHPPPTLKNKDNFLQPTNRKKIYSFKERQIKQQKIYNYFNCVA
jgi:hypothetical protein